MISQWRCSQCGMELDADRPRFTVAIEVYAPADALEIDQAELRRDRSAELRTLSERLEDLDPDEAMDDVYRSFRYTLCRTCHRAYLAAPLHPEWPRP